MRSFCAIMGALTIPVVYATMRESGYPVAIAAFTAALVLFGEYTASTMFMGVAHASQTMDTLRKPG